jgi:hypothetical protein
MAQRWLAARGWLAQLEGEFRMRGMDVPIEILHKSGLAWPTALELTAVRTSWTLRACKSCILPCKERKRMRPMKHCRLECTVEMTGMRCVRRARCMEAV